MSLPRPYLYDKNWLVFPDVVPEDISLSRCGNDVDGACGRYDTIQECIDECKNSGHCYYGYYISSPEKYCLNVDSILGAPHYDPTLDWKNAKGNPQEKVFAFVNKEKGFPNKFSNTIYFRDEVFLMGENTLGINTPRNTIIKGDEIIPQVTLGENPTLLTIDFSQPFTTSLLPSSDIINNEKFILTIKDTGYILRKSEKNNDMIWILRGKVEIKESDLLRLLTVDKEDKDNHISYGEKVYILYLSGFLQNKDGKLIYVEGSPGNDNKDNKSNIFYFKTDKDVYTCENGKCVNIPRDKIPLGVPDPKYNGKDTYRDETCFGVCDYTSPKEWDKIYGENKTLKMTQKDLDNFKKIESFPKVGYILLLTIILGTLLFVIYIVYIFLISFQNNLRK